MTHSFPPRLSSDIVVFAEPRRSRAKPVGPAPHALCFAAESPRGRRRAQPPRPDRRNGTRHQRRKPQRRYIVGQEGAAAQPAAEIGRASCRERVCQYVEISVVALSLKNKKKQI